MTVPATESSKPLTAQQVRARVVFLIRVPAERTTDFLAAYEQIRFQVANGVPGHLVDQVCQSPADPEQWLITSEWESMASFEAWEASPDHRTLVRPMRECMSEAKSIRFQIRMQTAGGVKTDTPGQLDESPFLEEKP